MCKGTIKRIQMMPRSKGLTAKQKRDLAAIAALPDSQIDTSEPRELPPHAWKPAVRGRFYRTD